ncbi:hypothetical protein Pyn_19481 [Prunus yedoensis var. nudiflora]|uniref:Uncharacterized protein n=1 Tax=Prunus yedoensis var. nudiflora TaxID=2094558 RepID=A0A314UA80_PRUYE|nr:hypothetical protein Pyn_19481 [Prunus yedoensis var. nudiflora]
MLSRRCFNLLLRGLICIGVFSFSIAVCMGDESSEFEALRQFIRAVDPQHVLSIGNNVPMRRNPCMHKLKGVKCNSQGTSVTEIRLENLNLRGILDVDSLCKLPNLQYVSLARNQIRGTISNSIVHCTRLTYLNLRSNVLSGKIPKKALSKLKDLRRLDISDNPFYYHQPTRLQRNDALKNQEKAVESVTIMAASDSPTSGHPNPPGNSWYKRYKFMIPLVVGIGFFLLFTYFAGRKAAKLAADREILKSLRDSPDKFLFLRFKRKRSQ